jgi:hypothetical protein
VVSSPSLPPLSLLQKNNLQFQESQLGVTCIPAWNWTRECVNLALPTSMPAWVSPYIGLRG